jgi:hypothetical protein
MIDSPQTDEQNLQHDETNLSEVEREVDGVETESHCGFRDASRRTQLLSDIEAAETKVLRDKERLAANRAWRIRQSDNGRHVRKSTVCCPMDSSHRRHYRDW